MRSTKIALLTVASALATAATSIDISVANPDALQTEGSGRPNILVIITDDQRADALGYMPATKRLFRKGGTTYAEAYSTTPLCCPSRASIMTGRYVHNHGVLRNEDATGLDHDPTLQAYLQKAGYQTALAGKFLNSWPIHENPPFFDRWSMYYPRGPYTQGYLRDGIHSYNNALFNEDGTLRLVHRYATDYIGTRARRFLRMFEDADATPWMLYMAPFAPHSPATPAARHRDDPIRRWRGNPATHEPDRTDKPLWVQQKQSPFRRSVRFRRKQLRSLKAVDDIVEKLFDEMHTLDETRDTLAFFLSDNGYLWGEHRLSAKRYPYLPSARIPLMARWPAHLDRGVQDDRLVANIDILPTVLDAVGIAPSSTEPPDGRSFLASGERARLLLEYFADNDEASIPSWASTLTTSSQYVEYYEGDIPIYREYYDLIEDPWQLTNLMGDADPTNDPSPIMAAEMSLQLRDDRSCRGSDSCP